MEIWETKSLGTLWATPGLLWDSSSQRVYKIQKKGTIQNQVHSPYTHKNIFFSPEIQFSLPISCSFYILSDVNPQDFSSERNSVHMSNFSRRPNYETPKNPLTKTPNHELFISSMIYRLQEEFSRRLLNLKPNKTMSLAPFSRSVAFCFVTTPHWVPPFHILKHLSTL